MVFAIHWQWVSKWSIQSAQRPHFLGIRHTCLTSTIFPCPSRLCFSIQAQGATPPWFYGPFFPRKFQEVVSRMNYRPHGCCVPWGYSCSSSSPLPTAHSKLPSSWSIVPAVDCGLSGGMIQTIIPKPFENLIVTSFLSGDIAHVGRQLPGNTRRHPHRLLGFLMYPLSILSVKAIFLPPADLYLLLLSVWWLFFMSSYLSTKVPWWQPESVVHWTLHSFLECPSYRTSPPILRTPHGHCGDRCGATSAFILWSWTYVSFLFF